MQRSTRRGVLRALGVSLPVALAGCNAATGDEATTTSTTTTESTTTLESPVSASLTRYEYAVGGWNLDGDILPVGDAVASSSLGEEARTVIEAAADSREFRTDDPSDALLRDIEGVELVEYDGTYYSLSHTFTEYVLSLEEVPEAGDDSTVTTYDDVRGEDALEEALGDPLPRGPEDATRPHRTLVLPPELDQFLDEYTHVEYGERLFRIDFHVERHYPPHTLTVERASEEALYGRELVNVQAFAGESREFLREVLDPAPRVFGAGWGSGTLFSNAVPREVEREFVGGGYTQFLDTPGDEVYSFEVHHVQWDRPPLELSVDAVTDPAGVTFTLENTTTGTVTLRQDGVAPFGILWALSGDGDQVQLWSPEYTDAPEVSVSDGVAEPDGFDEFRIHSEQTITRTYRLAREDGAVPTGTYELRGVLQGTWNRPGSRERPEDLRVSYPFGVTVTVEDD